MTFKLSMSGNYTENHLSNPYTLRLHHLGCTVHTSGKKQITQ